MFESFIFNAKAFMVFSSLRMEKGFKRGKFCIILNAIQIFFTLFFSKKKKMAMFLWTWFRKIDDIIDGEDVLPEGYTTYSYLAQKKDLVNGNNSTVLPEDILLIYSFKIISKCKLNLHQEVKKLFEVMEDEYNRRGKIISKKMLDCHMKKQDEVILKIIFIVFDVKIEDDSIPNYFGIFTKVDSLLDIKEDLKIKLINISLEDCEKYGIDPKDLLTRRKLRNINGLNEWYKNEAEEALKVWKKASIALSKEFLRNKKILLYLYQHLSNLDENSFRI